MASADHLEGDLVETAGLVLLVVVALIAYGIWKATGAIPTAGQLVKELGQWLSDFFGNPFGGLADTSAPFSGPGGVAQVNTGTNLGVQSDGSIGPGPDPLADYQIPQDPLQTLSDLPGAYIDPWAGLPPVQLPQIG